MNPASQKSLVPQVIELIGAGFDNKFAPHLRMANAIIFLITKNGGCLPQDLLTMGFTQQETIDLFHMANAMATVELKLRDPSVLLQFNGKARYA